MSLEQAALTIPTLCALLEKTRRSFGNAYYPLGTQQCELITKCSDIARSDRGTFQKKRNTTKARAHRILTDIAHHELELFLLLALSVTPTRLGSLKSKDYLRGLNAWWDEVDHPKGLREAVKNHFNILPKSPEPNTCQG
jgi:hypothetical protein